MTTVLITGAAGFIGSHAVEHVLDKTDWGVVALDGLTYAGDVRNYIESDYFDPNRVKHVYHDLRAPIQQHTAERIGDVDHVWHFASDSHVDRSIEDPVPFFTGNAAITTNLLEWARYTDIEQFVQVSTDEVYGPTWGGNKHKEWSTVIPSNPYSASKAAQEAISIAYWRTYGVPVVITNTMNNFGERQHEEKFIPLVVNKIYNQEKVPIHSSVVGNKFVSGSRCWLHARNHADALLFIAGLGASMYQDEGVTRPDRYHIAGEHETNEGIAVRIAEIVGKIGILQYVDAHSQRPGHDMHYGLDSTKLENLGWEPPVSMDESLERTVKWYLRNE